MKAKRNISGLPVLFLVFYITAVILHEDVIARSSPDRPFSSLKNSPPSPVEIAAGPRIDVAFLIDATGSMADEIDVVKNKISEMLEQIQSGTPRPDVRVGFVAYRDRGDEFVTRAYDFSRDINIIRQSILQINASGGGDKREDLLSGLHVALTGLSWDKREDVIRLLFVITDAGMHQDYEHHYTLRGEIKNALDRGIIINVIGCSGLEKDEEEELRKLAAGAEGTMSFLTYRHEYIAKDGRKEIVLEEAGRTYRVDDEAASVAPESWKAGASVLERKGLINRVAPSASASISVRGTSRMKSPRALGDDARLGRMPGERAVSGGVPAVEEEVPGKKTVAELIETGATENNLDSLITDVVKNAAKKKGVSY